MEIPDLNDLYGDTRTCAKLVGLSYVDGEQPGITRKRHGKGFSYETAFSRTLTDRRMKRRIADLVIPPAWKEVWICPRTDGHILATGIDEQGRKQYIYHPKWRTMRDLVKFYRMITFGRSLPGIRKAIDDNLQTPDLSRDKIIGTMLWVLDNAYLRVGNDRYFELNDSIGLTTLTDENVAIAGPVITLFFKGKSHKQQQVVLEHLEIAKTLTQLKKFRGPRLFRYRDKRLHDVTASDINNYLFDITGAHVSAKDFRTWGGTLLAFDCLVESHTMPASEAPKEEKAVLEAVDSAASILGNTRAVARSSYIHPDILEVYGSRKFERYYADSQKRHRLAGLDTRETQLLFFLERLFEDEFTLLK